MVQSAELSLSQLIALMAERLDPDPLTEGLRTISTVHGEIHHGHTFSASFTVPDGSPIADDAAIMILLRVGNVLEPHFTLSLAATGVAELEIFEGPDVNAAGNAVPTFNMYRASAVAPTMTVFEGPTLGGGGDGTLLVHELYPAGTKKESAGITSRSETEWILKTDEDYLIRLINRAGATAHMSITAEWYEHPIGWQSP